MSDDDGASEAGASDASASSRGASEAAAPQWWALAEVYEQPPCARDEDDDPPRARRVLKVKSWTKLRVTRNPLEQRRNGRTRVAKIGAPKPGERGRWTPHLALGARDLARMREIKELWKNRERSRGPEARVRSGWDIARENEDLVVFANFGEFGERGPRVVAQAA
jgi:hypothetical protein